MTRLALFSVCLFFCGGAIAFDHSHAQWDALLKKHVQLLDGGKASAGHPEKAIVVRRIVEDLRARLAVLLDLGLGYLTPERATPWWVAVLMVVVYLGVLGIVVFVRMNW